MRRRVPSARTLFLLTPGVGSPSTGGLEPVSRSRHSQGDVADTITIASEGHFSLLTASSQSEKGLEQSLELPDPSHRG